MRKLKKETLDVENLNEVIYLSKKILRILVTVIIIGLVGLILYLLRTLNIFTILKELLIVISPIFIGLLIAWLLDPIVDIFEKKHIPRIVGSIIVYLCFIGILVLGFVVLTPSLINQVKDFVTTIPNILRESKEFISGIFSSFGDSVDLESVKEQAFTSLEGIGNSLTNNLPNNLLAIGKSIASGCMFLILGLMIGFYMLYDFDKVNLAILEFIPKRWHDDAMDLAGRINHSLREYVIGVLTVMLLVFISQSICLTIAGLKAPLIFAFFCAVTDVIPYFGPYIGAIPAVLVGFTISPFVGVCTIIAILIVQLLENNFYQPLIMGHAMKLHPVTIMLGLLVFEHFFGIIGMIIATPVIATIKIILNFIDEKMEVTEWLKNN